MKVIAVVGSSGSGKTGLIERLAAEYRKRKRRLAVVKHCPHGFDLEAEGKDSRRFMRAGAVGAALVAPDGRVVFRRGSRSPDLVQAAVDLFLDADVVLVEGGSLVPGCKKIVVLGGGVPARAVGPAKDVVAYVSEGPVKVNKPVFRPTAAKRIADLIDREAEVVGPEVRLEVDGRDVPLKDFMQMILKNIILGLTSSLRGVAADPKKVRLLLKRKDRGTQKTGPIPGRKG